MLPLNEKLIRSFKTQIRGALLAGGGRRNIPQWLVENTTHPRDAYKPWSFAAHEYQLGILSSQSNLLAIQKAAQIGASELSVRLALGLAVTEQGTTIIYSLPTAGFARRFVAARVGTIIDNSSLLKAMASSIDNLEMKKLGSSFIYFVGAQKDSQAISIPASIVINDEYDFSDQQVLGVFESRLGHCAPGEERKIRFSTPTIPGVFINKLFLDGTQKYYMVRHHQCGQWTELLPERDVIVPGTDHLLSTLTRRDLEDPRIDPKGAWVMCPSCGGVISQENLADPDSRQWVAKFPDRAADSFRVTPLDVPTINPPEKIVKRINEFPLFSDYMNFVLGAPCASADNSILLDVVEQGCTVQSVHPNNGAGGCVMGLDVGRISWLTVGKEINGRLHLIWLERILQDGDNNLEKTVLERMRQFGVIRLVGDAQPDLTVMRSIISQSYVGQAYAAYFITGAGAKNLKFFELDEEDGTAKITRTRFIDEMVKDINSGRLSYPREHPDLVTFKQHLGAMKRVRKEDSEGGERASWVSTGDDHFFFSLVYLYLAYTSVREGMVGTVPGMFTGHKVFSKIRLRVV
jgi:hypothetical protein